MRVWERRALIGELKNRLPRDLIAHVMEFCHSPRESYKSVIEEFEKGLNERYIFIHEDRPLPELFPYVTTLHGARTTLCPALGVVTHQGPEIHIIPGMLFARGKARGARVLYIRASTLLRQRL